MDTLTKKDKIFISYSHDDKNWLDKVVKHLKVLTFEGIDLKVWVDTKLKSGIKWKEEIRKALEESI